MPRGLHGKTDAALRSWSARFRKTISASPETYGLSVAQAEAYAVRDEAYGVAYQAAANRATRSKVIVITKNEARASLIELAVSDCLIIQANLSLTDAQKVDIGLNVRARASRLPVPSSTVTINVRSVSGFRMSIRLLDNGAARIGKPRSVAGASIWSFIGDEPPTSIDDWTFERNSTRTSLDLHFSSDLVPGTKVWLCAAWFNPRTETGPLSLPISTHLQGGGVSMSSMSISIAA